MLMNPDVVPPIHVKIVAMLGMKSEARTCVTMITLVSTKC